MILQYNKLKYFLTCLLIGFIQIAQSQSTIDLSNFTSYHPSGQDRGTGQVSNSGDTLRLVGNAWKKILVNYEVTSNTIVSFDIKVDSPGEIHGFLFDTDNRLQGSNQQLAFKVFGSQNWGLRDYEDYTGTGWQRFAIPVGQFYTGTFPYFVFIADKDTNGASQDSSFRNLRIIEGNTTTILTNRRITYRVDGLD